MGRATTYVCTIGGHRFFISIHALRGEGDNDDHEDKLEHVTISIHALRGEGDNQMIKKYIPAMAISIHALRGEGDRTGKNQ